jgi:hypothetical protein
VFRAIRDIVFRAIRDIVFRAIRDIVTIDEHVHVVDRRGKGSGKLVVRQGKWKAGGEAREVESWW